MRYSFTPFDSGSTLFAAFGHDKQGRRRARRHETRAEGMCKRCAPIVHAVRTGGMVAVLVLLAGCQSQQIDVRQLVGPSDKVSFSEDVQPILTRSCGGCHIGNRTSGVSLDSYQQVTTSVGAQYGRRIVEPEGGVVPLLDKIGPSPQFGDRMPLGRSPLAPDEIATIQAWLDDGAPDN